MKSVLLTAIVVSMFGLGCKKPTDENGAATQPSAAQASSATAENNGGDVYYCPMHCVPEGQTEEYTQNKPGQCPVCKMDLVKRK